MAKIDPKSFKAGARTFWIVDGLTGKPAEPLSIQPFQGLTPDETPQTYSMSGLLVGSATYTFPLGESFLNMLPEHEMKYDIILSGSNGDIKATIESLADMERLIAGEPVECNWYKRVGDEWEFVIRHSLKFTFKPKDHS